MFSVPKLSRKAIAKQKEAAPRTNPLREIIRMTLRLLSKGVPRTFTFIQNPFYRGYEWDRWIENRK